LVGDIRAEVENQVEREHRLGGHNLAGMEDIEVVVGMPAPVGLDIPVEGAFEECMLGEVSEMQVERRKAMASQQAWSCPPTGYHMLHKIWHSR